MYYPPLCVYNAFFIFAYMKTILVTGSNGLLGQTLIALLASTQNIRLIATSKGQNRFPETEGYEYVEMDISVPKLVKEVVEEFAPDVIIHTAAITNVDICHTNRDECWEMNVTAVETLLYVCELHDIHFVHLSTDFVFDGQNGPYMEDDLPSPISFYGNSKYEAEERIRKSGCRWAILRTILVYGVTANMSRSNIVLWVKSALERGESIKVVNDQWRTPTLVQDLAIACGLVAEKGATGIFHIGGKDMLSVYDVAVKVAEFWKLDKSLIKPVLTASLNQSALRPPKTGLMLNKAIDELGYNPRSFNEGLEIVDRMMILNNS